MKRTLHRVLCAVLCTALLFGVFAFSIHAETAEEETTAVVLSDEPVISGEEAATVPQSFATDLYAWFFRTFGFLGFLYEPSENYVYNMQPTFQWLGGFNKVYDTVPWLLNVYADTLHLNFTYEGKDWLIQCWKGGYAGFLTTGGEIGVYTKEEGNSSIQYGGAVMDDWLNMSMTIYNKNARLFTRPFQKYWWCTGYGFSICTDFMSKPRTNVVADNKIELKTPEMAQLFIKALESKGFKALPEGKNLGLSVTETYQLLEDGKTVRFYWKNATDGWY